MTAISPSAAISPSPRAQAAHGATGDAATPHLTAAQITWLAHRLESADDLEACAVSDTDPDLVEAWRAEPAFAAVLDLALTNKREGFRQLSAQLLPRALRRLAVMIDTGTDKAATGAIQLLLRTQGLLDQRAGQSPEELAQLVAHLREPVQVVVVQPPAGAPPVILEGEAHD